MNRLIRIGTRKSKLALAQSQWVADRITANTPGLSVELVRITTTGDKIQDVPLAKVGGKGLFVKEIEEALLRNEIDLAVHSLKDVPAELPQGLALVAFPPREDPRDALVSFSHTSLQDLPHMGKVGTSSMRRACQLKLMRPDLEIVPIRGNVDTRLRKLQEQGLCAIILAMAGVRRLGLDLSRVFPIPVDTLLPAIGQGILGIEAREGDEIKGLLVSLNHPEAELAARTERSFLREMGGGCQVPMAGLAKVNGSTITMKGLLVDEVNKIAIVAQETGHISDPEGIGKKVASAIIKKGGDRVLERIYHGSSGG